MADDPIDDEVTALRRRLDLAMRAGAMGVWELDLDTGNATWTDSAGAVTAGGGSSDFADPDGLLHRVHPDDIPRVAEAVRAGIKDGAALDLEFRTRELDGMVPWVHAVAEVVRDADGRAVRVVGVASDVTAKREAGARQRDAEGLIEQIVSSSELILYSSRVTAEGELIPTYLSRNAARHLGYETEELSRPGRWGELLHPEDAERVMATMTDPPFGVPIEFEVRSLHRDGRYRWIRNVVTFAQDEASGEVSTYGYAIDVTERRRVEEELRQTQRLEVMGRLAGGVAHDLNNLLTAIGGYAELAALDLEPGSRAAVALGESRATTARAARLVTQLLAYGRRQRSAPTPTDVNGVVTGAADLLRQLAGVRATLAFTLDPTPREVAIDPGELEQVLVNLVMNAKDAMPDGGSIEVRTEVLHLDEAAAAVRALPPGEYMSMCVSDTGTGIVGSALPHVFEPFFTTKVTGSGLGLATLQGITTAAGGAAHIDSAPGEGTTVHILLPVLAEEAGAADGPQVAGLAAAASAEGSGADSDGARSTAAGAVGHTTVLLVEDHPLVRTLTSGALSRAGYDVLSATDGERAVALANSTRSRIDVLVTDVMMPGMSGPAVADLLRSRRPGLRVVFMSGMPHEQLDDDDPSTAFVQKPFELEALLAAVARTRPPSTRPAVSPAAPRR